MTVSEPLALGSLVVLGAPLLIALSPVRLFGRKLSLEEVISVCWVAWSIYMGAFVVYIGLKLPLGFSRAANAPAVGMAVCIAVIAVLYLARIPTDWRSAVTKSILGLFTLILGVVGAIYFFH
ncbi:hypothetical protein KMZ29_19975 [Bradyrhizobium sediminis]|uniref:Uncharacterized protein n=1 Tax=Bradyrhizobium sediminis TaxID=2840469 RepID=A0A975NBD4_9BRAD|nr:hypothetical protein [Bradyrhizobium sediminis]QWG11987.1 hypothetical protein KMZ29_19975 [Bradyrhizobium sediminis]